MIWDTVSSQTCFCWLYRASPSLASNNTINLILVLTIWWCPCVESSLVLLEEGVAMTSEFSWQNSVSLWPASFCTPRPNLPVTLDISWLPIFAFQSPIMKRTSFMGVNSRTYCRSSQNCSNSASSALRLGHSWITVILNGLPWKRTEIILSFLRLHPSTAFWTLLLTMMATPFLLRDSCPQ